MRPKLPGSILWLQTKEKQMTNQLMDLSNAFADAAEKAGHATVLVNARQRIPGSGIAFAADLILTANHVVERDEDISVLLADGTQVNASVAGRDPGTDLAVLKLEKASATPAEKAPAARVGQLVLAIGRPSEAGIEASLGTISAINGPVRTQHGLLEQFYRTDTTPYPGFSGGPLVDAEGRVVGINTSGFGRGMSITIPAEVAWKVAQELAKNGSIKRGYLGIRSQPVELNTAAQTALKREQSTGLLIVGLEQNSPAEAGGALVGDTLVGINGQSVSDHDDLFALLSGEVVGKTAQVQVLRGGQPLNLPVLIEERKEEDENEGHRHHHRHGRR
jgi:S1-C subfamily serine protease